MQDQINQEQQAIVDTAEGILELFIDNNADFTTVFESLSLVTASMLADYAKYGEHDADEEVIEQARERFLDSLHAKLEFVKNGIRSNKIVIT